MTGAGAGGRTPRLIGRSPAFRHLVSAVRRAARSKAPLVLTGETGTGKTLLTQWIHAHSGRADRPFVIADCGRLRGPLLEAELFGVRRGAATGVDAAGGRFVAAHGGTLVLEHLHLLEPGDQGALLRVLETGAVSPVGGGPDRFVDVRILVTSLTPLRQLADEGRLREDLLFRLQVLAFQVPPLRERAGDPPLFFRAWAGRSLDPSARLAVARYPWPGNLWELQNAVTALKVRGAGRRIQIKDLPPFLQNPPDAMMAAPGQPVAAPERIVTLADLERDHVLRVLKACGGQRGEAARLLGISRKTLWEKLRRWSSDGLPLEPP